MTRITQPHNSFLAILAPTFILLLAPAALLLLLTLPASATLNSLQNSDFEDGNDLSAYVGAYNVPGWEEYDGWSAGVAGEGGGIGAIIWTYTEAEGASVNFPAKNGDGALGFIHGEPTVDDPDTTTSWVFQSLGIIDAGDVGKDLTFDINAGARAMMAPTEITIAFRTGTQAGVGGPAPSLGTVLGTAGTLLLDSSASPTALEMAPVPQATYTVDAGDIGQELYVVVSSALTGAASPNSGGQVQFHLDDAVFAGAGSLPELTIDRDTGKITLTNVGSDALNIQGYSISSAAGSLDQAGWTTIAGNYDNEAGPGDGSVDLDDDWRVLSQSESHTDLSEFQLVSGPGLGDGGVIGPGDTVDLSENGGAWLKSEVEDVTLTIADSSGVVRPYTVNFINGPNGEGFPRSDLDFDGEVTAADWPTFVNFFLSNMDGLSPTQSYQIGDLNRNGESDLEDYDIFESDFEAANGSGSFAAMLASVPEPSSVVLLGLGVLGALVFRRTSDLRGVHSLVCLLGLIAASLLIDSPAFAALGTLQNTGFEEDINTAPYVGAYNVPFWQEYDGWSAGVAGEGGGLGALVWTYDDAATAFFPAKTGNGALGFDHVVPSEVDPDADKAWVFQSLGVATAGDVGKSLTFDINAGARQNTGVTEEVTIAFRTGTEAGVGGTAPNLGTVLGTAGSMVLPNSPSAPLELAPVPQASYTVDAADVGKEIFVVVSSELQGEITPGQKQYLLDDAVLFNPYAQFDTLTALVNRVTGNITLINNSPDPVPFDLYKLSSAGGSLDPNWIGLSDLNVDPVNGGDDPGETWDEAGGSSATEIAELFLQGNTTLGVGEKILLQDAYDTTTDAMDLELVVRFDTTGLSKDGFVEYIKNGDMNDDGSVDELDVNPFVQALIDREGFETAYADVDADVVGDFNGNGLLDLGDVKDFKAAVSVLALGSSAAVPEPSACLLVSLALATLIIVPYRQNRR